MEEDAGFYDGKYLNVRTDVYYDHESVMKDKKQFVIYLVKSELRVHFLHVVILHWAQISYYSPGKLTWPAH